jgi:large subunit ribosomal protein L3
MFGFAKKLGMTRLFIDNKSVGVTVLELADNVVLQRKTEETDGYSAVQVASNPKTKGTKATTGHNKKYGSDAPEFINIAEFKVAPEVEVKDISIEQFAENDLLKVSGKTIGRGFTGVVKRYDFRGQPASHGHDHERAVGSIGAMGIQRVLPGTKMAGRHGNSQQTLHKVKIVAIDPEQKLLFVKGSLPGPNSNFLKIEKMSA